MTVRQPRYPKEEYARRGNEIYETQVRSQVEEGNHGRIVAMLEFPMLRLGSSELGIEQSTILAHGV
jgi:hypothetical protein